ncbi:hypothetical protein ABE321_08370 [Bacillus paralicheniformis]|uniref:Uncharacterized protein n=1 Tax=Bacillus paralicheniformis TaxID=1648923 RepID=A0AAW6KG05_9BACI|nr:hypothetical protein [Bacillus paralicheniformis]MBZ5213828.1 hypothetical protein [Bacillus paralicheniformis]MCQ5455281.1 hypothetical protein [Bacillus paralicheniformis]MCU4668117.1 hypothetical protein [Bacillus paralicheniformis]MDE1454127.1 hypothetical protein [Bacillus paralicheniformis]MEC1824688.1 hypothetical protein [Bacillus paralicheniformis]
MENDMKNFLVDLVSEIQEKYNESLNPTEGESAEETNYRLGSNFSYYEVLELIKNQLNSFGYSPEELGTITPLIGEKIKRQ